MASIALGEHYERFIKKQLESGRYNNASEIVRAGLRMLEDYEDQRERWLTREMSSRLAEYQKDPGIGIPLEDVFAEIEARHRAKAAKA